MSISFIWVCHAKKIAPCLATDSCGVVQPINNQLQTPLHDSATQPSSKPKIVCSSPECLKHDLTSQDACTEIMNKPPTRNPAWSQGMSLQKGQELLGGHLVAYKIQWFNGSWSGWFVPGTNDLDWKYNTDTQALRRVWSYFEDHVHGYILCK